VSERFLVTGALGCIGAWTTRLLVREGTPVVALDAASDRRRLELVLTDDELERVTFVHGDITDLAAVDRVLDEHGITHVVHLAALQVPFVRADPPAGARVNVVGTTNLFEAAKRGGLPGLAYASSAAVWGPRGTLEPETLYGVFKLATEGLAGIYWAESGLASVGLRPYVVFGPGRDQGVTSAPTLAMEAAARGEPFRIAFGGRTQFHYAPDVAAAFVTAARSTGGGAAVHDLGGPAVHMRQVVEAIEAAAPESRGTIEFDDVQLPFPEQIEGGYEGFRATPLEDAVRETVAMLRGES
jgi:nucleoside-diphosphate-sugar epimerase